MSARTWCAWFGFHDVFHALTVAAFTAHYIGIFLAATDRDPRQYL
ncbi:hypothetical protein [Streptomyces sp. NPDC096324]